VAKDEENGKWLASETRRVDAGDWNHSSSTSGWTTRDFLLRIDDEEVSEAPMTLAIRGLRIFEEDRLLDPTPAQFVNADSRPLKTRRPLGTHLS
jgi:hypothetical protein